MKRLIKALNHDKYIQYTKGDEYDKHEHKPQSAWEKISKNEKFDNKIQNT
ncbi:hypothetical protein [Chryseobacterium nematophagum]|nr:hypothetical protein [Chryseobacterium nematophagum]